MHFVDFNLSLSAVLAPAVLLLAGCAASLDAPPRSFDLTGEWVLDEVQSDAPPDLKAIRRREDRDVVRGRQSNPTGSAVFVVQDYPVLNAARLHIEQDAKSMGIRYDRNTYRDISWGRRERDFWTVQAGWVGGALVIRTARGGIKGEEIMALEDRDQQLRIAVRVTTEGGDIRVERVYRRR